MPTNGFMTRTILRHHGENMKPFPRRNMQPCRPVPAPSSSQR
jgi:hypothetical protein